MTERPQANAVGTPLDRVDGWAKVTGGARYAHEYPVEGAVHAHPVRSTVARGRIVSLDPAAALRLPGVLAVLSHLNAPRLVPLVPSPPSCLGVEIDVFQSDVVVYRGQFVAAVVAETPEIAREAARLVAVGYDVEPHDVALDPGRDDLLAPEGVNGGHRADTVSGDVEAAMAVAPHTLDHCYTTPLTHPHPMEPHATIAVWDGDAVTVYDSNQGAHRIRGYVATAFGLPAERVRVVAPYVGGGFGGKLLPHPHLTVAIMAAREVNRPVKIALTRQQMSAVTGYRSPTVQRVRLAASADGTLLAVAHEAVGQTAITHRFAEQTAVAARVMYAAPNRRTSHRLARLNVPVPTYMRAPGECPGMFALESAMDEMAERCGTDPVDFRIRNIPPADPTTGLPFSSHGLEACLREGARLFGWEKRRDRVRRAGRRVAGWGVAASTYPAKRSKASASIRLEPTGRARVLVGASDIGTGARTILTQIAADALGLPVGEVSVEVGDSDLPVAGGAGGSMGTASCGSAIVEAAQALRARLGEIGGVVPPEELEVTGTAGPDSTAGRFSMHAFGAQFAEIHLDTVTGEIRVPRLLGVFAVGRVINPKTARSQLAGGMTMGLSMALHEESSLDHRLGFYVDQDLSGYHFATHADVESVEVSWIEEDDPHVNPIGAKGLGEIGIVGTAAAVANAVHDATGRRFRDLPLRPDRLVRTLIDP
ncbi:xanthine dehydrogenase family protein molybdopterin-binding subunit [Microbispora amethystogenes]|uniref:xanthine dehydrogenase family protein molybdopterin-binding subunit n=1 Tax=Microbispora amethystogenes TaxID=1427754 RepID=UPI0033C8A4D5